MKFLEEALTIIHIRISGVHVLGYRLRHVITIILMFMVIVNLTQLFYSTLDEIRIWHFLESSVFLVVNIYLILVWIKSWPKAGAMLNKAGDYENDIKS